MLLTYSCRTTLSSELLTSGLPSYSMKPSLLQLFMKKFTPCSPSSVRSIRLLSTFSREHYQGALRNGGGGCQAGGGARPTLSSIGYHGGPGRPPHTRTSCTNGWQFF